MEQSNREWGKHDVVNYTKLAKKLGSEIVYSSGDFEKKDLEEVSILL